MKKSISFSIASILAASLSASDLGTIQVESSTIDDRVKSKRTEVSSTATISGESVDEAHRENIQQILQSIPGVTTEVSTGDSLKIHLRGVENQMYMGEKPGVAIVIDGVPVFERTGKVNIDLDNIESIKVIKGGASYLFGDDALSGAVIITTKKGAKYNHNFATAETGSFGYRKLLARTGYSNEDLSFHIQASEKKSDGYHYNSEYNSKYINGKFQYYIDDLSDITFGLEYSDRKKDGHGTVGGETQAKINPKSKYNGEQRNRDYTRDYNVELLKLFLTYSKDFQNDSNLLVNTYVYTDSTTYLSAPQTKNGAGIADLTLGRDDYIYDTKYDQIQTGLKSEYKKSFESSAAMLGLDLRANKYKEKQTYRVNQALVKYSPWPPTIIPNYYKVGDFKSDSETKENVYALYGEYKQGITKDISATANLRYDLISLDYKDHKKNHFKDDFRVYSYRLGTNYQLDEESTFYVNYSTGFRAPTVAQLYAGSTSAWGLTENNPDLKPEQSLNYELGIRTQKYGIAYEASIFLLDRKDFIMKSSGNYGDTSTADKWDNIGGARHKGLELSASGEITKEVSFNLAYTYLDAKYTKYDNLRMDLGGTVHTYDVSGNDIPRTSKHQANLILNYQALKSLLLTAEVNSKSDYYADDLNKLKIKGNTTLNLGADYKIKVSDYVVALFARVDNVFDDHYYNTARASGDRDENGVYDYEDLSITVNPGIVYTAGLSVKF